MLIIKDYRVFDCFKVDLVAGGICIRCKSPGVYLIRPNEDKGYIKSYILCTACGNSLISDQNRYVAEEVVNRGENFMEDLIESRRKGRKKK